MSTLRCEEESCCKKACLEIGARRNCSIIINVKEIRFQDVIWIDLPPDIQIANFYYDYDERFDS
jgi:hypothetical protein